MASRGGGIKTPTNQKLHTNIAVVRIKKGGKRFEIACYKNKVISWREGIEKDIDEVLQSHTIFLNVSKGEVAKKADLIKCFEKDDQTEVCKLILAKGDLQVSDKERQAQQEAQFKEIATTISEKCVNPETKRPYPVSIIEKAMKECHVSIKPNKGSKAQALETIGKLQETLPIQRAQMRMRVTIPVKFSGKFYKSLKKLGLKGESEEKDQADLRMVLLVDPGMFGELEGMVREDTQGAGNTELLNLKEVVESEETLQ